MAPWKLPLVVAAIAVPIVAGFVLVGPGVGLAVGALVAAAIVFVAVRQEPRDVIAPAGGGEAAQRLLLVVAVSLEDPATIAEISRQVSSEDATVMVLAPARIGFLDRWASDVEGARRDAQRRLVLAVAALAKAGIEAEARVGDEDVVQAVEDQLGSFPATEVILVTAADGDEGEAASAAAELQARLPVDFRWIVSGPAAR